MAAIRGDNDLVNTIMEAPGADVNVVNTDMKIIALFGAASVGYISTVSLLIKHGAHYNV